MPFLSPSGELSPLATSFSINPISFLPSILTKANSNERNQNELMAPIGVMSIVPSETDSGLSSEPLFSCLITIYLLILLYLPQNFSVRILLSPVLILASSILLSLLRLGAAQRFKTQKLDANETGDNSVSVEKETDSSKRHSIEWVACNEGRKPSFEQNFVEWNVGAPLEVIYEEYEGEEGDGSNQEERDPNETQSNRTIERYPSLSLCFPESDSDSSSDGDLAAIGNWGSPERVCFRWEEDDGDEMIEIALDKRDLDLHGEEDSLIEIDVSSAKTGFN